MRTRLMGRMLAALLALAAPAAAQPIVVEWQHGNDPLVSTLVAAGADVTINLDGDPTTPGIQPVFSDTLIRIHETGTSPTVAPQFSVGSITVNGTPDPLLGVPPRINVLVAASTVANMPNEPDAPLAAGLVNLGNSNSAIGIQITDASLRGATRLTLSITGSTFGATEIGAVFRFEVDDTVHGNITATATNGSLVTQNDFGQAFDPIREFRAGNAILGHVTATGGDIDSIIVFGTSATGIRGDIQAPNGHIRRVWTTGNIGTSTTTPKIWAGDGIDEIIAGTDTGGATPGAILDRDFNINVDARVGNFYLTQPIEGPRFDGALVDIRTDGDITGSIRAANLSNGPGVGGVHRGIIAGGVIAAPITIDLLLERADIIGSSITAPVWIGHRARGAIVASDVTSGVISGDSDPGPGVGYAVQIGFSTEPLPISAAYDSHAPGFVGSNCGPLNVPNASVWYNPPSGRCLDQGSLDSVIRAVSIGRLRIANMFINGASNHVKEYIPRIEGQTIASIEIGNMREGVVWSGVWDTANTWTGPNEPANDYAEVGDMSVTCVGPGADLWLQNTPLTVVYEDLLGEIYVPTLAATERIIIGGRLGDAPDFGLQSPGDVCGDCLDAPRCLNEKNREQDSSPRGTGFADHGAIIVRDDLGLEGQIIINANADLLASPATHWKGRVNVGSTSPISVSRLPSVTQPDLAPHYQRASADLGGGSIGLVPYSLHGEDSHPPHNHLGRGDGISQREFNNPATIAVWSQSYGPVFLPPGESITDYVTIEVQSTTDPCQWTDSLAMFQVILHPDLNNNSQVDPAERRYIGLRQNGHIPVPGIYRVSCYLPCDDLQTIVPLMVSWPAWTPPPGLCFPLAFAPSHVFRIWPDCDDDGLNDLLEIDGNGSLDADNDDVLDSCESSCHICDVNNSGAVTVQDIFDFLAAYFLSPACVAPVPSTSCSLATLPTACVGVDADVNDSCTVSVQDIFDFLSCYFASQGDCP